MNDLLTPEQRKKIEDRNKAYYHSGRATVQANIDVANLLSDREAIAGRLEGMASDLRDVALEDNNHALFGAANGLRALITAIRGKAE